MNKDDGLYTAEKKDGTLIILKRDYGKNFFLIFWKELCFSR